MLENGDVFVSFYGESAAFKNSLGFYTYDAENAPQTIEEIEKVTIIFPNCSDNVLEQGAKVKIGNFTKGTGIGFVLVADGFIEDQSEWIAEWENNGYYWYRTWTWVNKPWEVVANAQGTIYTKPEFNRPEVKDSLALYYKAGNDEANKDKYIIGFEDIRGLPDSGATDYDIDDTVFCVTGPFNSKDIPEVDPDPTPEGNRITYYPAKEKFSTFAYEDLWPKYGDFDFNDLLTDVNYKLTRTMKNEVVELVATVNPKASGASLINGFSFVLDIPTEAIVSVEGQNITRGTTAIESTEDNKTVIVVFDAIKEQFPGFDTAGNGMLNTLKGEPEFKGDTLTITIKFKEGYFLGGDFPFDPFMFDHNGTEIHLMNNAPINSISKALLGSKDDASNIATGKYYVSSTGLPWAIEVLGIDYEFRYSAERNDITQVYSNFSKWAQSGGNSYKDWYNVDNYPTTDFDFDKMYK